MVKDRYSDSEIFYTLRSVAIISVLCAHSSYSTSVSNLAQNMSELLLLLGLVGVPIFLLIQVIISIAVILRVTNFLLRKKYLKL